MKDQREDLILEIKRQAKGYREDTLVSMAESVANERIVDILDKLVERMGEAHGIRIS